MKKYDAYKDSGVKWIGEIPNHWEAIKISRVHPIIGSGTTPLSSREDYYSEKGLNWLQTGDLNNGLITETSKKITPKAVDECKMKFYPIHSVVIAMYGATIGKVGLLDIETATNQACCIIVPSKRICPKYTFYSFIIAKEELLLSSFGGGQPNISQDIIRKLKVPVPPLSEQQSIASYVDVKTEKIDKMIAKAEKKIEYLGELKQSLITRAVTRGLNPNTPLKDSGVNWIGNIPMHWDIACLRFFLRLINGRAYSQNELLPSGKYKVLRVGNFFTNDSWYYSNMELEPDKYCDKDDLLYAWSASVGPYIWNEAKTIYHYHIWKVQLATSMDKMYSYYLLRAVTNQKMSDMHGSTMMHITMGDMNKTKIPIPPLSEQQQIATYLDTKCSKIDHIIATQKKKIAYLQELIQSLITNVVTGKIKVS